MARRLYPFRGGYKDIDKLCFGIVLLYLSYLGGDMIAHPSKRYEYRKALISPYAMPAG